MAKSTLAVVSSTAAVEAAFEVEAATMTIASREEESDEPLEGEEEELRRRERDIFVPPREAKKISKRRSKDST